MKYQPSSRWHRYEHDVIYSTSMIEKTSFQSNRQSVSASTILQLTDRWRQCAGLATAVTGPQPIQLPCVDLQEAYGVCKRVEHGTKTTPNSQHWKILEQYHSALQDYTFPGQSGQKMYPNRQRQFRITCMNSELCILCTYPVSINTQCTLFYTSS